jgi:low temperature requirement protein LtrA
VSTPSVTETAPRRVHWMELFFDLVFVVFITELAQGLHGHPGVWQFVAFIGLYIPAWWAWINMTLTINLTPELRLGGLALTLVSAMVGIGLMAAAAPEGVSSRAWAFALGCVELRVVFLVLWLYRARRRDLALWRPLVYNGVTALLWLGSIWVPQPWQFGVWAVAVLIEMLLLIRGRADVVGVLGQQVALDHLAERLGLFLIIVIGESVLSLIVGLSTHWTLMSALTALFGLLATAALAWAFFAFGTPRLDAGLDRLLERGDSRGMRDTVMYLPYLLVVGVTMFAAGLSTAVGQPNRPLGVGAAIALGGGVTLFYLTNWVVSVRFGESLAAVAVWAVPAVILSAALIVIGLLVPAFVVTICAFAVVAGQLALAQARRARESSTAGRASR